MHNLRYVNANNMTVQLNDESSSWTRLDTLRSYKWDYATTQRPSGAGGKASGFGRWPKEATIKTSITCTTREALNEWQNSLQSVTEPDVLNETPGRLYIDDQYMTCYIVAAETEEYNLPGCFAIVKYTVLAVEPYWCTEVSYMFGTYDNEEIDTTGKKYNLRYPYRYGTGLAQTTINNKHYAACPAIITMYGNTPTVTNPYVTINNIIRQVNVSLLGTERVVINQLEHTIYKVNSSGAKSNVFNSRNKNFDIFAEIPAGEVQFSYPGTFKVEITLIQQRSMPKWTS